MRHNERKAVKILNSASKDNQILKTGESISTMYFNNLGCLHAQMQKYNLASFYFCRAIAENEEALSLISTSDKSECAGKSLHFQVLYNVKNFNKGPIYTLYQISYWLLQRNAGKFGTLWMFAKSKISLFNLCFKLWLFSTFEFFSHADVL